MIEIRKLYDSLIRFMADSENISITFRSHDSDIQCNRSCVFLMMNPIQVDLYIDHVNLTIEDLFVLMHERGHILAYQEIGNRHTEEDAWDCAMIGLPPEYHSLTGFQQFREVCLQTYDCTEDNDEFGIPLFPGFRSDSFF